MNNNIDLYIPKLEDYWYQEKIESDANTMSYNAGYDVSYYGYHYDTGCIDFPKEKWEESFNRRVNENRYLAYIRDLDLNEFIGYVNYYFNKTEERYCCGIVIEYKFRGRGYAKKALKMLCDEARSHGVEELYDTFEIDRGNTLELFKSVGFEIFEKKTWKKFGQDVNGVVVRKVL